MVIGKEGVVVRTSGYEGWCGYECGYQYGKGCGYEGCGYNGVCSYIMGCLHHRTASSQPSATCRDFAIKTSKQGDSC